MKTYNEIREHYTQYHRNKINILIHQITVPLLFISTYGLLTKIATPEYLGTWFNFGLIVLAALLIYFTNYGVKIFSSMAVFFIIQIALVSYLNNHVPAVLPAYAVVFVLCWTLQFYGHIVEGKRPAFVQDLHAFPLGLVLAYEKKRF